MANRRTLLSVRKNYFLRTFLWALGLATIMFLPWIIYNDGYFFFYGDYNVQQIPFYQMIHDSTVGGNIGWSYTTDLGANIIGSYSFYMMGSPFFWFTFIFPSNVAPYLVAPLLIIKIALCALGAYTFLRRYVKNQNYAVFGALLYAFSGFSVYDIFFNHFHEAMITFPFMLAAVDEFIYEKRKGVMAYAVFASSFINYYFFAGQAVFVFIYWVLRMKTGSFRMSVKAFLRFAVEIILGFAAAAVILFPSILAVLQNSRLNSFLSGWNAIVYSNEQRYVHIIETFFFPPDMPAYANFTPDSNAKWASVAGWLPLFGMIGTFSFYKLKTHKWLRIFIPVLFVMAFIPLFNSFFQLLNASYYARWFYMLTLMLALATSISLDRYETDFSPGLTLSFIITGMIAFFIGAMPTTSTDSKGVSTTTYGLAKYPDRFWMCVGIAGICLAAVAVLMNFRKKEKVFIIATSITLSVVIVGYGTALLGIGVLNASYRKDYIEGYAIGNRDAFKELEDLKNVRSDFYDEMDNMGMYWQIPTIQAFQSIVPGSVMDFYKSVGVERSVGSRPKTDVYGIRSFLSCKYLFDNAKEGKKFAMSDTNMQMPGWSFIENKNGYNVYENDYYIPYGFTYDTYVTKSEYDECTESKRHLLLLKSMVLTDEQAEKYKDCLKHDEDLKDYKYTNSEYYKDCEERNKLVCSSVKFDQSSFTAKITTGDSPELVFFSIPYEKGWSATVNGKPAKIEKVNVGFMAVEVPEGTESKIVFTYETPGLKLGAIVSGITIVVFVAYMFIWKVPSRRRKDQLFLIDDMADEEKESYDSAEFIEVMATDESDDDYDEDNEEYDDPEDHPQIFDEEDDDNELEGTIEAMSNEVVAVEETPSDQKSIPEKDDETPSDEESVPEKTDSDEEKSNK